MLKRTAYISALALSLFISQYLMTRYSKEQAYPLASWNLFSQLPLKRELYFLFLEDRKDKTLCYFYLCPRIDQSKITSFHPFNILLWRRATTNIEGYINSKINLEEIGYKIHIVKENTLMSTKWNEIKHQIKRTK